MILKTWLQKGSLRYLLPSWNALARKGEKSELTLTTYHSRGSWSKPAV